MSLSDNPFVFFARCGTNKIAHVSIHHPFAKEELKEKSTCIGCQYEVSTKTTVFQLTQMSLDLKSKYDKATTQIEKDRLKTIVTQTILPKLQDVLLCIKENYGDTEFSIMNNLVKELTANEQQRQQQ